MFSLLVMHPNDADRMANSVGPDQTAPDFGLHCLLRPICPNTFNFYGLWIYSVSDPVTLFFQNVYQAFPLPFCDTIFISYCQLWQL